MPFDKINHWYHFAKLIHRKLPLIVIRILYVWYNSQTFAVQWGNSISASFRVSNGVRQGGILSPTLFNVYLNDLSNSLNESKVGCQINSYMVNHLFYADDSALLAPSPKALKALINICEVFADHFELVYNSKKTVIMCFKPKNMRSLFVPAFTLNDKVLEVKSCHKYLGVFIHDGLKDDIDINRELRGIYARGNVLIKKFLTCSEAVKIKLFKSYCNSFYSSQLWCNYNLSSIRKLHVAYNHVFRKLMKLETGASISAKFVECSIDGFRALLRKLMHRFRCRVFNSDNILVHGICSSVFFITSKLNMHWTKELYILK